MASEPHRGAPTRPVAGDAEPPPVTVLLPAFNMERYLQDAVTSVQMQDYPGPLTIVIWDDGSRDQTLQIAERLAAQDSRIVVRHHANQGRAVTRQCLLEAAQTELIAWLDPDDLASPRWIREQVQHLRASPDCVAVGGQGYAITPDRFPIGPIPRPLTHEEIDAANLAGGVAIFQTGMVARASAMKRCGGYRREHPVGEDTDMWLRLAEVGRLCNVSGCHVYYRVHEASLNFTTTPDERRDWMEIVHRARERRGLPPLPAAELPSAQKDDWNRRIFWINIAAREANAMSCLKLLAPALKRHPGSLQLWLFLLVALADTLLFAGNRNRRFVPGSQAVIRPAPRWSAYRVAGRLNRWRRRLLGRSAASRSGLSSDVV